MSIIRNILNFVKDIYRYIYFPYAFIAFRGVYDSFESATKAIPKHSKKRGVSYNDAKSQNVQTLSKFYSKPIPMVDTEYPVFFWLDRIISSQIKNGITPNICDFGGGEGRHYFAYVSHTHHKPLWRVCELGHNVKLGRAITAELGAKNLHFISKLDEKIMSLTPQEQNCNIFLSSGALFYLENVYTTLREYLTGGGIEHILLTRLPLQDKTPTYVTLQNALSQFYIPLYIFNRDEFIGFFNDLGYELYDEWKDPFDGSNIPFHRDISALCWSGLYFRRKQQ